MSCSQFLYAVVVRPWKVSGVPEIAVTMDPVLVELKSLREMRRGLAECEGDPDGLEASDAGGKATRGDPTSLRSCNVPLHEGEVFTSFAAMC